ncbi:MAG: hypothetical protein WAX44_00910 [Minisyncoccia bacterium]
MSHQEIEKMWRRGSSQESSKSLLSHPPTWRRSDQVTSNEAAEVISTAKQSLVKILEAVIRTK